MFGTKVYPDIILSISHLQNHTMYKILLVLSLSISSCVMAQTGVLNLSVVDKQTNKLIPFRIHLKDTKGKGKVRKLPKIPFWVDHNTVDTGKIEMKLPIGAYEFEIESGLEYTTSKGRLDMPKFGNDAQTIVLQRVGNVQAENWFCADLDNRRSVLETPFLIGAEAIDFAPIISWNNSGKNYWQSNSLPRPLVQQHNNALIFPLAGRYDVPGCAVNLFNLPEPVLSDDSSNVRADSVSYLKAIKDKYPDVWIDCTNITMEDLPILVALNLIDSVEILDSCFGRNFMEVSSQGRARDEQIYPNLLDEARWKQQNYFHLLNCGYKLPPTAGSGSGEGKNPLGYNRVYVKTDSSWSMSAFWEALKKGQAVVTNGPIITPTVDGFSPGHVFTGKTDSQGKNIPLSFNLGMSMVIRDPISYIEIIKNGKVYKTFRMDDAKANQDNQLPPIDFSDSGWFLIRAVTDLPDTYRCAISAPFYVQYNQKPYIDPDSVRFFQKWMIERGKKIAQQKDKYPEKSRAGIISAWSQARDVWLNK